VVKLLSIEDSAGLLSISPWTVRKYIREGKLRPVRIGRRVLLEESELERFIMENRTVAIGTSADEPRMSA